MASKQQTAGANKHSAVSKAQYTRLEANKTGRSSPAQSTAARASTPSTPLEALKPRGHGGAGREAVHVIGRARAASLSVRVRTKEGHRSGAWTRALSSDRGAKGSNESGRLRKQREAVGGRLPGATAPRRPGPRAILLKTASRPSRSALHRKLNPPAQIKGPASSSIWARGCICWAEKLLPSIKKRTRAETRLCTLLCDSRYDETYPRARTRPRAPSPLLPSPLLPWPSPHALLPAPSLLPPLILHTTLRPLSSLAFALSSIQPVDRHPSRHSRWLSRRGTIACPLSQLLSRHLVLSLVPLLLGTYTRPPWPIFSWPRWPRSLCTRQSHSIAPQCFR